MRAVRKKRHSSSKPEVIKTSASEWEYNEGFLLILNRNARLLDGDLAI